MEGFLNKQGDKGLVVNLWRKRWFQLDPAAQRMYYYKTKSKEELLGSINLAEASGVVSNEPKDSFSFTIQTRDRAWHLSAASEVDKTTWMQAIASTLKLNTASKGPTVQFEEPQPIASTPKNSEYGGIFEFEGEDGESKNQQEAEESEDEADDAAARRLSFLDSDDGDYNDDYAPPAPPNPTPLPDKSYMHVGSLPMNVPRLASTWQPNTTWCFDDDDDDDDKGHKGFEKPHEVAAKTYKEITIETGIDFTKPRSYSKRVQTFL